MLARDGSRATTEPRQAIFAISPRPAHSSSRTWAAPSPSASPGAAPHRHRPQPREDLRLPFRLPGRTPRRPPHLFLSGFGFQDRELVYSDPPHEQSTRSSPRSPPGSRRLQRDQCGSCPEPITAAGPCRSRSPKVVDKGTQALRVAARTDRRSRTVIGPRHRGRLSRKDTPVAITATAREPTSVTCTLATRERNTGSAG